MALAQRVSVGRSVKSAIACVGIAAPACSSATALSPRHFVLSA